MAQKVNNMDEKRAYDSGLSDDKKLVEITRYVYLKTVERRLDGEVHLVELFKEMLEEKQELKFSLDLHKQLCEELGFKPVDLYTGRINGDETGSKGPGPQSVFKI